MKSEVPAAPASRRVGRTTPRADVLRVTFDLLAAWDLLATALVSRCVTAAYMRLCDGGQLPGAASLFDSVDATWIGAVLAAVLLRCRPALPALDACDAGGLLAATGQRLVLWAALMLGTIFVTHSGGTLPRLWVTAWMAGSVGAMVAGRLLAVRVLRAAGRRGLWHDRVAVVGAGPAAERLLRGLRGTGHPGARLACAVEASPDMDRFEAALAELTERARRGEIDRVVVALPASLDARAFDIMRRLKALDVEVSHCPALVGLLGEPLQTAQVGDSPVIVLARRPFGHGGLLLKSMFDRLVALLAIVLLAPLLALVALAVWLESPGPVIFRQTRHGWNGTEFTVFKFRTMRWRAGPAADGAVQTRRGDERVTRLGAFLRATSMDELPQFINVLNGTMSLVGPRPHPVVMRTENRLGGEIIAEYPHRHRVRPGITGWAQINGCRGATATADQVRRRVEHDLYYIDNWSFLLDLRILVVTLFKVVAQRGNAF